MNMKKSGFYISPEVKLISLSHPSAICGSQDEEPKSSSNEGYEEIVI